MDSGNGHDCRYSALSSHLEGLRYAMADVPEGLSVEDLVGQELYSDTIQHGVFSWGPFSSFLR